MGRPGQERWAGPRNGAARRAAEPENAAYRDSLGWALFKLGRYDEAVVELEKAASVLTQPDGVVLDHLGDATGPPGNADAARAKPGAGPPRR